MDYLLALAPFSNNRFVAVVLLIVVICLIGMWLFRDVGEDPLHYPPEVDSVPPLPALDVHKTQEQWDRWHNERRAVSADEWIGLRLGSFEPSFNPNRDALIDRINEVELEEARQHDRKARWPFPTELVGEGVEIAPAAPAPSMISLPVVDMANLGARA